MGKTIDPEFAAIRPMLISQEEYDRLAKKVVDPTNPTGIDNPNPCVRLYGYGPEGAKCKDCLLLQHFQQAANWYKCLLRHGKHGGLGGPTTDHKVRWDACSKFEKEEESSK
jgi:hypothetical protein